MAYVATANSGSDSFQASRSNTKPGTVATGDIVIFYLGRWNESANFPAPTSVPANAVLLETLATGLMQMLVYAKYVEAGETTYTFNWGTSRWSRLWSTYYTGRAQGLTLSALAKQATTGSGTSITSRTVTAATGDDLAWGVDTHEYSGGETHTPPTSFTEVDDNEAGSAAYRANVSSGSQTASGATVSASQNFAVSLVALPAASGSGTTGTVAVTQAGNTSSASGQLGYTGTSARTQADNTSAISGTVANPVTGTSAVTQANSTGSAAGVLGYTGTVARTQASNTSTASGVQGYTGTVAVTQAPNTSTGSGVLGYSGTSTVTQAGNIASASGTVTQAGFSGSVAVTQDGNTSAASGVLGYTGTISETQDGNTSGTAGTLGYTGAVARTQADNISSASGLVGSGFLGSVAVTQASQTAAASGILGYIATAAVTQAANTAASSGKLGYTGTVARTQANNAGSGAGLVANPITGTIVVVQASQVAAASGSNQPLVLFGTSSAGVGIVPSSHPNRGLAPYSTPAVEGIPSASAAAGEAPTSTGA